MRKIVLSVFLLVACEANTANPPPQVLIPEVEMENILYDIALLKSMKNNHLGLDTPKEILNNNYILRKYKLTDSVLKKNQIYYAQSPKKMFAIYDRIHKRLEKVEDSLDVLAQKEQEELEERLQREKDSLAREKVKDSLARKKVKDSLDLLKKSEQGQLETSLKDSI